MSANTDTAIHCWEGSTGLICQQQQRISSQIAQNDWQRTKSRGNKDSYLLIYATREAARCIKTEKQSCLLEWGHLAVPFSCFCSRLGAARGNGCYTKPGFLWPEQKRLAANPTTYWTRCQPWSADVFAETFGSVSVFIPLFSIQIYTYTQKISHFVSH